MARMLGFRWTRYSQLYQQEVVARSSLSSGMLLPRRLGQMMKFCSACGRTGDYLQEANGPNGAVFGQYSDSGPFCDFFRPFLG